MGIESRKYHPEIEAKIRSLIRQLQLNPSFSVSLAMAQGENNYTTRAITADGHKVFFKVGLIDYQSERDENPIFPTRELGHEIIVYQALSKVGSGREFITPQLLASGQGDLTWILLDDVETDMFGFKEQFEPGMLGCDMIKGIVRGVESYQKLFTNEGEKSVLPTFVPSVATTKIDEYLRGQSVSLKHLYGERGYDAAVRLLDRGLKTWGKEKTWLVHGDFGLQNIGFNNGKIVVLDWERAHLSNNAFDFSKLYVQTWRNPYWQSEFIKYLLEYFPSQNFKELFNLGTIIWCLTETRHLGRSINDASYGYSKQLNDFISRDRMVQLFEEGISHHISLIKKVISGEG
jgi:hypothetical protein